MADLQLVSYTDLKGAVAKWLNRGDLTDQIPAFVVLAEAEIRRVVRRRTKKETIAISTESTTLPSLCAELRAISPHTTGTTRTDWPTFIVTPEVFAERRAFHGGVAGKPRFAKIVNGTELVVSPAPDASYNFEIEYFEKLIALSADNQSNYVYAEAPDIYLFGSLLQAAPYLKNDERVPLWRESFDRAVAQLNDVRDREEYNASLRPARLPVTF